MEGSFEPAEDFAYERAGTIKLQNGDMVPMGNDAAYGVEFYNGKVPNFDNTDYIEVPHIRLKLAGDNNRVYDQPVIMQSTPVRPSDPERFPREWAAFQRGELGGSSGTLLVDWDRIEPGDVRRLELQGLKTVEQLAHVGDHQLANLGMGSRALREAARQHISSVPDPEKAAMQDQVMKLTAVMNGMLNMLTPEQREQLTKAAQENSAASEDKPAPAKAAKRQSAVA